MKKLRGSKKQGKMMKFIGNNGFDKKEFIKQSRGFICKPSYSLFVV